MKRNKTLILMMFIAALLMIALFAYLSTLERDGGEAQTFPFPTTTPTPDLVGSGWWDEMPTPVKVEGAPSPTPSSTPTPKP
jgi:hypothetical protein